MCRFLLVSPGSVKELQTKTETAHLLPRGRWDGAKLSFWELKRSHVFPLIDCHFSFFPKKFAPVAGYLCEAKKQKKRSPFFSFQLPSHSFWGKNWWEFLFVFTAFDEVSMLGGILITSISVAVITTSFTEHYQQRCRVHEAPRCERRNHREAFSRLHGGWWKL